MTDAENTEEVTPSEMTLSTKVPADYYEWFVEHAKENFRNISGQLAYVLDRYRKEQERGQVITDFAEVAARAQIPVGPPAGPRGGNPTIYRGAVDPGVTVSWGGDPNQAALADEPEDDPEEGVG